MQSRRACSGAKTAAMHLPLIVSGRLTGKSLKFSCDWLKRYDSTAVSVGAQRLAKLACICAYVENQVNSAVMNEVGEVLHSPPSQMQNSHSPV